MNDVTFVLLCFEGPDKYSHAGGLGSRVTEMSETMASLGFETHLFFIGDPDLPGCETTHGGKLHLHRWGQWISRYHATGVYDGEETKLADWEASLPAWLEKEVMEPKVAAGGSVIIMAEEWHTVGTILSLRKIIDQRGWQDKAHLLWNANNTFSFHRVNWPALKNAATITSVSRYMKHVMWGSGVDARVIPNGISDGWFEAVDEEAQAHLAELFRERLSLVKVARWDPDKRWDMTIDSVAELKRIGMKPLFLARGGIEAHRFEVLDRARRSGLDVASVYWTEDDAFSFIDVIRPALAADVVNLQGRLSFLQRRALFRATDAVLANSGIEPFGLVGLETMAVGGVAFVGCTGEDYVTPGHDAISIQSSDPKEIVHYAVQLRNSWDEAMQIRQEARKTAERYTWSAVIRRVLIPFLREKGITIELAPVKQPAPEPEPILSIMAQIDEIDIETPTSECQLAEAEPVV